jgi:hypothetical protein
MSNKQLVSELTKQAYFYQSESGQQVVIPVKLYAEVKYNLSNSVPKFRGPLIILLALIILLILATIARSAQLDFNTTWSTNNATVSWVKWTNGTVLRYDLFWTPITNADTGTNWATTTNWSTICDVGPDTTNFSLANVPTNTLITEVIMLPGGRKTVAFAPWGYTNYPGPVITNQPVAP